MTQSTGTNKAIQYAVETGPIVLPYQRDRNSMFVSNPTTGSVEIRYGDAVEPTVVVPAGALWEMPEPTWVGEMTLRLVGGSGSAIATELL